MPEALPRPRKTTSRAREFASYLSHHLSRESLSKDGFAKLAEEARDVALVLSEPLHALP